MLLEKFFSTLGIKSALAALSLGLLFALGTAPRLNAQVLYGSLVGNVTDSSGAAVPGATVKVTQAETGFTRSVVTDQAGGYNLSTIPAGTYTIEVSTTGFKTYQKSGVNVSVNTVERVDASLVVGAVTQSVEVTANAQLLQTDRADVHHDLSALQIQNVPLPPGNNFEALFRAVPGVNPPSTAHSIATNPSRSLAFNSNGTSQLGNDIKIDGVSQWNIWTPENSAYIPSSDALETVNLSTNSYNVDQGFAGGSSANVITRSGGNQIHGDLYEYHYDNKLEALEFFAPRDRITRSPKDVFNQFGGSIGGPIKKDKLFYFSNVEFTRNYFLATQGGTVPTDAMRKGDLRGLLGSIPGASKVNPDFVYDPATGKSDGTNRSQIFATNNSADPTTFNSLCQAGDPGSTLVGAVTQCPNVVPTSRLSPITQKLLGMLPEPNLLSTSTNTASNNFLAQGDVHFNRFTTDDKINWNATDKFNMAGHIGFLKYNTYNPQIFGALGGNELSGFIGNEGAAYGHTITVSATGNYVASPNFVVDVTGGFTRQTTNSAQLDIKTNEGQQLGIPGTNGSRPFEGSWPRINISGFSFLGTQNNFMPYFRNDPQVFLSANATWIHGKHSVRFGGAWEVQHLNQEQPEWNAGGTSWPAAGGFDGSSGPTQCKSAATSATASASNCFQTTLGKGKTSASNSFNGLGTFLLGLNTGWGRNIQVPDFFHTNTQEYSLYVGDTWQVTRNLTANLGLRWEYYPFPTRSGTPRGVGRYDFTSGQMLNCGEGNVPLDCGVKIGKKYFSPRIGLAYRASNSLVVRAGFGMSFDPFNIIDDVRTNYPILIPLNQGTPNSLLAAGVFDTASLQNTPGGECASFASFCFGTGGTLPVGIINPAFPSLTASSNPIPGNVNLATTGNSINRGYIMSWNFTVQKQLGRGWVGQAGYVATRSVKQLGLLDLNVQSPIAPAGCDPTAGKCGGAASRPFNFNGSNPAICATTASTALGCRTGGTSLVTPVGENHYDSLQATLNHRWSNGFDIGVAYTWSKTIGVADCTDEKSNCPRISVPQFYTLNQGLSNFDRPSNLGVTFIDELPFGTGRRWAKSGIGSKILGGWQLSGLLTSVSNTPIGWSASNSSLNTGGNQRPDFTCAPTIMHQIGPGQPWFDPGNCISGVNTQRFGTMAFYQFHGPHDFDMDAALLRTFKLTERFNFQLRAQALNVTNTPSFANPSGSCGSIPTGQTSGCSSSIANGGGFGTVTGTSNIIARENSNGARLIEFNMRLNF